MQFPHLGETLSVVAALIWAFSVVLFRMSGRDYSPLRLNFFKNMIAIVLVLLTLAIMGETLVRDVPASDYWLLALSGVLGITVADTIFFRSLNIVGAGLSQIVSFAYSPFVILFSFTFLGERLSFGDLVGACLILAGILITSSHEPAPGVTRSDLMKGIGLSTLSVAIMALGIVVAKPVLNRSPVMWATAVRLLAGVVALVLLAIVSPRHRSLWTTLKPSRSWRIAVPAAVLGAYLAMVVWIAGMKYTQASTASILNQTSAVFVLPVAALVLHEPVTPRKLLAVALAIAGVILVTLT